MARDGFKLLQEKVASDEYDLIVADELNVALDFGLVELDPVIELIKNKPPELELVITGRNAHPDIIELADLVSEVCEIKHHYRKGVQAREGVEF